MLGDQHQCMRTTLTLDEDVAAKLQAETRRSAKSFREVVNETLRRGLVGQRATADRHAFRVTPHDLGGLRAGQSLDMDAALDALAIEHGATLYTTDRDFSRFARLTWKNPLVAKR
jgi:predicted nucleic acid-binding protein